MKKTFKATAFAATFLASVAATAVAADTGNGAVVGRWDATLSRDGVEIPFRLDIAADGSAIKGVFMKRPLSVSGAASVQNAQSEPTCYTLYRRTTRGAARGARDP